MKLNDLRHIGISGNVVTISPAPNLKNFDPGLLSPKNWYAPDTIVKSGTDLTQWNDKGSENYPLIPIGTGIPQIIQVNSLDIVQFLDTNSISAAVGNYNHMNYPSFSWFFCGNYYTVLNSKCLFSKNGSLHSLYLYSRFDATQQYLGAIFNAAKDMFFVPQSGINKFFTGITYDSATTTFNIYFNDTVTTFVYPGMGSANLGGIKPYSINALYGGSIGNRGKLNAYENIIYDQAFDSSKVNDFKNYFNSKYAF